MRACIVAAFALVLLAALCVPAVAAWADGGSVELGVGVKGASVSPADGASGSVDLGVRVGTAAPGDGRTDGEAGGSVPIGIAVGLRETVDVSFVGYLCDGGGSPDASTRETIGGGPQKVTAGDHAAAPAELERDGYWADAWYVQDPTVYPGAERVDLDTFAVEGPTTLYCLWKKGYAVRLDANNGDKPDVFRGSVGGSACVMVKRDAAYDEAHDAGEAATAPAGVAYADFPEATRPGYTFKGWYWPEADEESGEVELDEHGRAVLAGAGGEPVAPGADGAGEMSYDFIRAHAGKTLYAKWEVDPGVRVELADARDEELNYGVGLWFWSGRGYTLERPEADGELVAGAVVTEPGELGIAVAHNPVPDYGTQYFSGWGYAGAVKDGEVYKDDCLVSCEKVEDADGVGGTYVYKLTERAFASAYVDADMRWADVAHTSDDAATGARKTSWDALSTAAHIRVSAPFEVTFQKAGEHWDADTNPGDVLPYSPDELEWKSGQRQWIQSLPLDFTNLSDRSVYVSGLECVNVGASAILPGGAGGARLFSLYEDAGEPAGATAIPFGYATAGNANIASVSPYDTDKWLVLPVAGAAGEGAGVGGGAAGGGDAGGAGAGSGGDAGGAGTGVSKRLYYGLDLKTAAFDRAAVAVGDEAGASYVAKIANVKYTYAIVP